MEDDLINKLKIKIFSNVEKIFPNDFQAQVGFGFDFYMTYFKFSTEFKMSFGMNNLLKTEPNMYATSVTGLKSRLVQISFLFE